MITLRAFEAHDTEKLLLILNDPEVTQFLSSKIPSPYTPEDAQWWVSTGSKLGNAQAIIYNDELIGCISADRGEFEYQRSAEVGYWLAKPYWGKGLATRALNNMVQFTFSQTNIVRLYAAVFDENAASMALLKKCGFECEVRQKQAMYKHGKFYDCHVFSMLKPESTK